MGVFVSLAALSSRPVAAPIELLRKVPLFSGLGEPELASIAELAVRKRWRARATVVRLSDPGGQLFVIVQGHLKAVSGDAEGHDTALAIMGPGEVFGEISLLDGRPRSATVVTLEECELLMLDREPFLRFLQKSPKTAIELLRVLTGRVRSLTARSEDLAFLRVGNRLAKRLADLAERHGQKGANADLRIPFKLSQQEIGDLVGATRESANKQIKAWEQAGLLSQEGGRLVIHDVGGLRALAGDAAD